MTSQHSDDDHSTPEFWADDDEIEGAKATLELSQQGQLFPENIALGRTSLDRSAIFKLPASDLLRLLHAIEVKTTQASASIHEFSGLHQLEPNLLPSGAVEQLHLMSIGLAMSTAMGETLPSIVSSIVTLFSTSTAGPEIADEFVRRVSLYGSQSGGSYAHETMREWSVYGTRYAHTFPPRLYRVDDPAMRLLRRETLAETFVQAQGLSFTMHIPEQISAFNPAPSWEIELEVMDPP